MKKHRNRLAAALLAALLVVLPGQGAFAATLQELQQEQVADARSELESRRTRAALPSARGRR